MNGKFHDLTMLEAVGDLLHAETSAQRRQAQSQLTGDLGKLYDKVCHARMWHIQS